MDCAEFFNKLYCKNNHYPLYWQSVLWMIVAGVGQGGQSCPDDICWSRFGSTTQTMMLLHFCQSTHPYHLCHRFPGDEHGRMNEGWVYVAVQEVFSSSSRVSSQYQETSACPSHYLTHHLSSGRQGWRLRAEGLRMRKAHKNWATHGVSESWTKHWEKHWRNQQMMSGFTCGFSCDVIGVVADTWIAALQWTVIAVNIGWSPQLLSGLSCLHYVIPPSPYLFFPAWTWILLFWYRVVPNVAATLLLCTSNLIWSLGLSWR